MERTTVEYNQKENHWRVRNLSDNMADRYGWIIIGECDRNAAESFVHVMIDVQTTPPSFRFTVPSFVDLLFRQHLADLARATPKQAKETICQAYSGHK